MRISPIIPAVVYFLMGLLFLLAAYRSTISATSIWNATTVILTLFTTFMLSASFRLIRLHLYMKRKSKKK